MGKLKELQIDKQYNAMLHTESLKQTIMRRDGLSSAAADQLISEASEQLRDYLAEGDIESAENICQEYFGLEPDYVFDLLKY